MTLSVIRRRVVGYGFFEELSVLNHRTEPLRPEIAIVVGADFADVFEVKDAAIEKRGKTFNRVEGDTLVLGYERAGYIRETWIRRHDEGAGISETGSSSCRRSRHREVEHVDRSRDGR